MESGGWAAAHGVGLAETTLHDEHGLLGPRRADVAGQPDRRRRRPARIRPGGLPAPAVVAASVVVAHADDVGRVQFELAVAEHEARGPARERGRRSPRLRSTRTEIVRRPPAVSIVTRSEPPHFRADGGNVSD